MQYPVCSILMGKSILENKVDESGAKGDAFIKHFNRENWQILANFDDEYQTMSF